MACITARALGVLLLLAVAVNGKTDGSITGTGRKLLAEDNFPDCSGVFKKGFLHGFSSSAFQYEGTKPGDGLGDSIWDVFCRKGKCQNEIPTDPKGSGVKVRSIEFMKNYKTDIKMMADAGVKAFRLSLSWPRLIPKGKKGSGLNMAGIIFYKNVINTLLQYGITPVVTLYHWDLPASLEGDSSGAGWMDRDIVTHFVHFADIAFRQFGSRVRHWITLNEPYTVCMVGYRYGSHAPGKTFSNKEEYVCGHNMLRAHAYTVDLYRKRYKAKQQGKLSIALNSDWSEPYDSYNQADVQVAAKDMEFRMGWFADPVMFGRYPISMRDTLGSKLPYFTPREARLLRKSTDFFALNYYTANWVQAGGWMDSGANPTQERNGRTIGSRTASSWHKVAPWGFAKLLSWVNNRYGRPNIWVTETGMPVLGEGYRPCSESVNDFTRVNFFRAYIGEMCKAAKSNNLRIGGFLAWSFLDNFEWAEGTETRFGTVCVDYDNNLKRVPKASFKWLSRFWAKQNLS